MANETDKEIAALDKRIVALGERVEKLENVKPAKSSGDAATKEMVLELYERVFGYKPE